jgi:hypothetical protein
VCPTGPRLSAFHVRVSPSSASIRDLGAQRQAEKELLDRLFGKPKTAVDIGGGDGVAIIQIPKTAERAQIVAQYLMESGAVSGALMPGESAGPVPEAANGNGNGDGSAEAEITDAEVVDDGADAEVDVDL